MISARLVWSVGPCVNGSHFLTAWDLPGSFCSSEPCFQHSLGKVAAAHLEMTSGSPGISQVFKTYIGRDPKEVLRAEKELSGVRSWRTPGQSSLSTCGSSSQAFSRPFPKPFQSSWASFPFSYPRLFYSQLFPPGALLTLVSTLGLLRGDSSLHPLVPPHRSLFSPSLAPLPTA